MNNLAHGFSSIKSQINLYGWITVVSIFMAILTEWYFLAGIPVFLLIALLSIADFKKLFFLLLGFIPLSMEIQIGSTLGTDLPTEPLIVGLMLVYFFYVIANGQKLRGDFIRHPISILLLLHFGWIFVTTLTSNFFLVSLKFLLAKTWYITVFYFMAGSLIQSKEDIKKLFWWVFVPLIFTISFILLRHAGLDFAFKDVNKVVYPFYRNHVSYACLMALFFPFIWLAAKWYPRWNKYWLIIFFGGFLTLIGIYFSFTRAAYVAIVLAGATFFIIKWRLMKTAIGVTIIGLTLLLAFLVHRNNYLEFAPDYNKTITHESFDNLLEATYKMEDISTMERVYRWVAGFYMSKEERFTGFGPGNFTNFYKIYTVRSFRTYVSHNPENSGIHSYYLMTMVEQGIPGLLIFIVMTFFLLLKGETIYHQTKNPENRRIVLMAILCIVVIDCLLMINDMLETDKVGPFFFISMAILVNWDLKNKKESDSSPLPSYSG